ncbi:MAG: 23S rRNA (adenine(2503)-C(2))-methyltransferase RlmN [Bdellovibrionales bacterium]|nr:23S rRNA (adenine(2503)-C(2))-methyltransferase RlmN [Bdellovibrionales bacterium]
MQQFFSHSIESFTDWVTDHGQPSYRAGQVYEWMFAKKVFDFSQMTNLPENFRKLLIENFTLPAWKIEKQVSTDGTQKFHFELEDGKSIEAVWIPEKNRQTLCVSSQVGCALKCQFCVTGLQGFARNLTQEEILEQIRHVMFVENLPLTNLVFMGMGEPLLNFENLCSAIDLLKEPKAFGFGHRKISVSTAGTVPKILPFIDRTNVSLAVSLTGSTDETRNHWMPINQKYNLSILKETLMQVPQTKWKKIMFEVVMIHQKTDTEEQAKNLVKFLRGMKAKVNLIPYNENEHFPQLKAPKREDLMKYRDILMKAGYYVSIRKNRGQDIMGACGQLSSHLNQAKMSS